MGATTPYCGFELGPIRPPSEAYSLLIRVTRNCPWNRCRFCSIYKGSRFGLRPVEHVKEDIRAAGDIAAGIRETAGGDDGGLRVAAAGAYRNAPDEAVRNVALWLHAGAETAFLQDANTLIVPTPQLVDIISTLRKTLPSITRVTSYGRSKTAAKKTLTELQALKASGLSRLHIGLESGSDQVLALMDKGVTAREHILGGRQVVGSGISLSEYVMPGLGGRKWRREHASDTARALNDISPDFVRIRSLVVREDMALFEMARRGEFEMVSDDEMVEEIGWMIEGLTCRTQVKSDHMLNLLQEVEGTLPQDKGRILKAIGTYLSLSAEERLNFKVGRRTGRYETLSDMADPLKREHVDGIVERLHARYPGKEEEAVFGLRAQFM